MALQNIFISGDATHVVGVVLVVVVRIAIAEIDVPRVVRIVLGGAPVVVRLNSALSSR
jgi:hypothetical protein